MPPLGAGVVISMLCVAKTTMPLCDTVNIGLPTIFFIIKMLLSALVMPTDPVTAKEPVKLSDPVIIGANSLI